MPRDPRLFITIPLDFPNHPKVRPLPITAKWAFVEMNVYSREHDLDGRFSGPLARSLWSKKDLAALAASHPKRPLVTVEDDVYVIRDYAEHQETTSSIEERRRRNAENGRKGGRPKKTQSVTESDTDPLTGSGTQSGSEKKAESRGQSLERQTDVNHDPDPGQLTDARADQQDEDFIRSEAERAGIRDLERVRRAVSRVIPDIAAAELIDLTRAIVLLATGPVRSVEAYVETACVNSPHEVLSAAGRAA